MTVAELYYQYLYNASTQKMDRYGFEVFSVPVYSPGYFDCCGVAMFGGKFVGLSHYDLSIMELYVTTPFEIMKRMAQRVDVYNFFDHSGENPNKGAIVWGGNKKHIDAILKALDKLNIPLIKKDDDVDSTDCKNVIAIPTLRQVLMYSQKRGYILIKK